jgi:hypothetical protein
MGENLMHTFEAVADPLLTAIGSFKLGMAAHDAHPDAGSDKDQIVAGQTYLPALQALREWTAPAVTRAGALAALELANQDLEHSLDDALLKAMVRASLGFFRNETVNALRPDLRITFTNAIAASDRHTRMESLYDALAHLSDSLSGLVSRPRMAEEGPGAEALEALDDFVMDQMDAVKNRALAAPPIDWADEEARIALRMKHVARYRMDADQMAPIVAQLAADLAAIRSPA